MKQGSELSIQINVKNQKFAWTEPLATCNEKPTCIRTENLYASTFPGTVIGAWHIL